MAERKIVEHIELEPAERWEYYRRYYRAASAYYEARESVVDEAEVERLARGLKSTPEPSIRRRLDIRDWRFRLDPEDRGLGSEYWSREHDESAWEAIRIPHSVNHVPPDPIRYGSTRYPMLVSRGARWDIWRAEYALWYKARIGQPRLQAGEVAYLRFESVNLMTDVWVNDDPVMLDHMGLFPFQVEVSEELSAGQDQEALVSLRVRNRATNTPYLFENGLQISYGRPPYSNATVPLDTVDASWAGIAGPVYLSIMDRRHLEDVFLRTESIGSSSARIACRVELRNEAYTRFRGSVRVELAPWTPVEGVLRVAAQVAAEVLPVADAALEISFDLAQPALWSVDAPALYLVRVVLVDEQGREIDDLYSTFGVRTIELQGTRFLLNGKPVVPRGTHDLSNYWGESLICPSDKAIVRDILLHKGMNAVCSRWPSDMRMHYPRIAEYCDQLGYLLSWTGYFEMWNIHPEAELYSRQDVRALVRSLRNHPSIIVWEMGDEPLMLIHPHRRWRWYEGITELVEAEDRSRPIIPAGAWCNELQERVDAHPDAGLPLEQKRRSVLEDYPLFQRENVVWDYHYCPYHPGTPNLPTYEVIGSVKRAFGQLKPAIMTEFGVDGMPRFENVRHIYGEFRWKGSAMMPVDRTRSDIRYYGRAVGQEDWRETQAAQAVTMAAIIGQLRESPEDFAGYYCVTMVDPWTFTWGMVDAAYNAKLAYHVVRACYGRVYVSGLHGSAAVRRGDGPLLVTASTYGDAREELALSVRLRDSEGAMALELHVEGVGLPAEGRVTELARIPMEKLRDGYYTAEYEVRDLDGAEIARFLELFILRE